MVQIVPHIVIFDYKKINENIKENSFPDGIEHVFINGGHVFNKNNIDREKLYGRVLSKQLF